MNINSTLDQPYQLTAMLFTGIAAGILYVLSCSIRSVFSGKAPRIICDILFSVICGGLILTGIYHTTYFRLRLYHLCAIAAGFAIFSLPAKYLLRNIRDKVYKYLLEKKSEKKYNK